jgi:NAD(P) transhydrogenase subunit alpha
MGVLAEPLAAVNVYGGFMVTQRMLEMFRKKEPKVAKSAETPALAKEGAK